MEDTVVLEPVKRLSRDLKKAAATLGAAEARFLVDQYYAMQEDRIRADAQIRSVSTTGEPHETLTWLSDNTATLERQIRGALDVYGNAHEVGRWAKTIPGIGPVISAGLLAHIDIGKAITAGHIWRYAGLDSTVEWHSSKDVRDLVDAAKNAEGSEWAGLVWLCRGLKLKPGQVFLNAKLIETPVSVPVAAKIFTAQGGDPALLAKFTIHGDNLLLNAPDPVAAVAAAYPIALDWKLIQRVVSKRPWNASLKTLCWKIGESFVKVSGKDDDVYGHVYVARKQYEIAKNESGVLAEQAARKLEKFKIGKDTDAYKAYITGKLPPAHIHARAKRYAVKLFLAHYQQVAYYAHYRTPAPKPYVITHLHHAHEIPVPNWPF